MRGEENSEGTRRRLSIAAFVVLLAGAGVVAGSLLPWVKGPSSVVGFQGGAVEGSPGGLRTIYGLVALGGGALVVLSAFIWLIRRRGARVISLLVLIGAAASAAVAGYYLATLESRYIDFAVDQAASPTLPAAKIRDLVSRAFKADIYTIDPGVGLYLVLGAGAIAALIGFVTLVRGPRSPRQRISDRRYDRPGSSVGRARG
jgi:hypothetical protein